MQHAAWQVRFIQTVKVVRLLLRHSHIAFNRR